MNFRLDLTCSTSADHWPCGSQPDEDCLSVLYVCDGQHDCQVMILLHTAHTFLLIACQLLPPCQYAVFVKGDISLAYYPLFALRYYCSFCQVLAGILLRFRLIHTRLEVLLQYGTRLEF